MKRESIFEYLRRPVPLYLRQHSFQTRKAHVMVALGSLASSLSALLHVSGVLLPGFGQIIGAFSSLPLIAVTLMVPGVGFLAMIAASCLAAMFHPLSGLILLLTYGPLGFVMGLSIYYRLPRYLVLMFSGSVLAGGICLVVFGLGLPAFALLRLTGLTVSVPLVAGMVLLYCWLWLDLVQVFLARLPYFARVNGQNSQE
ncbi:MAG: hypothetical protein KGZ75_03885 [Syntrophomonadaceae bacterium]|nr:hypothetical protein [Syntrophomonadaceae bacterium]